MVTAEPQSLGARRVEIGRIVHGSIRALRAHGLSIVVGVVLLVGVPSLAVARLNSWVFQLLQTAGTSLWLATQSASQASNLLQSVMAALATAWVASIIVAGERSGRVGFWELAVQLARNGPRVIALAILSYLAITLAVIPAAVPALILSVAWVVIIPALTVEGRSVRSAFGRSLELTRGNRWLIFGLSTVVFVVFSAARLISIPLFAPGLSIAGAPSNGVLNLVVFPAINVVDQIVTAVGTTVLFLELVRAKEGGLRDSVVEVFA